MDENGKKNNLMVILLLLLLIAACGFIVYDKILKKEDACPSTAPATPATSTDFYKNMVANRTTAEEYTNGIEIVLGKDGNVYYAKNGSVKSAVGTKGKYTVEGYFAGIGAKENEFEGYKLPISNVILMYHSEVGQSGEEAYVFIKDDGTIGKLTYDAYEENEKQFLEIKEFKETVSGYKNIVGMIKVQDNDGQSYKLYDINGKVYE